ncbi:MAG: DUF1576 domain-containing protein [Fidelibacterota bacterium]
MQVFQIYKESGISNFLFLQNSGKPTILLKMKHSQHNINLRLLLTICALFIGAAFVVDGFIPTLSGFLKLQTSPARLLSDFIEMQGIGPAFFNGAVVALIGIGLILISGVKFSGPTFAAVLTMLGFGLFGKTPVNILPIFLGVFLAAKTAKREFKEYLLIALFGTALGPLVSFIAFELGGAQLSLLPAVFLGAGAGALTGFILPAVAMSMLHLHQGYNLYNIGLTCGFIGVFAASFFKTGAYTFASLPFWYSASHPVLIYIMPTVSVLLILVGIILDKKTILKNWISIQKQSGRLPSDFFDLASLGSGLFNAGLIGIIGCIMVLLTGSSFNGPVLGGILTIIGFGAFGTHPRNSIPIILGVIISAVLFQLPLNSPGVILAILFSTTLGPLAGQFGVLMGLLAGFIHMIMVSQTGSWHGAINLYNNGFAGGLTAALLVAIIQWFKSNTTINPNAMVKKAANKFFLKEDE